MKKVLIITYYWPPSGGPGVQRWLKFVKYFPQFGIEPIIITVKPSKASYAVLDHSLTKDISADLKVYKTDTFELYSYYKKFTGKKEIPYSGFANEENPSLTQKLSRFVRGNFFIPDPRKGWNKFAMKKAKELIKQHQIDTIITSSPPHSTQLIGLKLKQQFNIKWIADLRDPWTDIYFYNNFYPTKIAEVIDKNYEKKVLQQADIVTVVSEAIKEDFANKSSKIDESKIKVVPNGFDEEDFKQTSAPPVDKFTITYTGTLTFIYGAKSFIDAIDRLSEAEAKQIKIQFIGKVDGAVQEYVKQQKYPELYEFIPHVKHSESIEYLLKSTILLLAIPEIPSNKGILTGKLFEYLAARKPILCIGPPEGNAAAIINDCEAGVVFDYKEVESLKSYMQHLLKKWQREPDLDLQSLKFNKYSRKSLTEKFSGLIIQ